MSEEIAYTIRPEFPAIVGEPGRNYIFARNSQFENQHNPLTKLLPLTVQNGDSHVTHGFLKIN